MGRRFDEGPGKVGVRGKGELGWGGGGAGGLGICMLEL